MKHYVYWIHYPNHDTLELGYIGITSNISARLTAHRKSKQNPRVRNALSKGAILTPIFQGSKEACIELEIKLRPNPMMGWNLVAGGGIPPKFIKHTEEAKVKISEANRKRVYKETTREKMRLAQQGSKGSGSKLTEEVVILIRKRLETEPVKKLATEYNVGLVAMYNIKKRVTWKHC